MNGTTSLTHQSFLRHTGKLVIDAIRLYFEPIRVFRKLLAKLLKYLDGTEAPTQQLATKGATLTSFQFDVDSVSSMSGSAIIFGLASDMPIAGDFDGYIQDEVGLLAPMVNQQQIGEAEIAFHYGLSNSIDSESAYSPSDELEHGELDNPTVSPTQHEVELAELKASISVLRTEVSRLKVEIELLRQRQRGFGSNR
ncbi:MAG: hypothetical protein U0930_20140 [Pirellulales bacterium]